MCMCMCVCVCVCVCFVPNLFDKSGGKEDVERTAIEFSEISLEPKDTLAVDSNKVKTDDLGKIVRVRIYYSYLLT